MKNTESKHLSRDARYRLIQLSMGLAVILTLLVPATSNLAAPEEDGWESTTDASPDTASELAVLDRHLLQALTPEQYQAFADGADPESLVLASGETLTALLDRELNKGAVAAGLVYHPVATCTVVRTPLSDAGRMGTNEVRNFIVRGTATDLSSQGGSATGCGVPQNAEAIVANFRAYAPRGKGRLKAWASGAPFPKSWLVDYEQTEEQMRFNNASILDLCSGPGCGSDFKVRAERASTHMRIAVMGYFVPAATHSHGHNNCVWVKVDHAGDGPRESFCPSASFAAGVRADEIPGNAADISHFLCCEP